MRGIVACETLYDEVERLAPDAAVRYVPHDLHESPIHVGDDRDVGEAVREAVADLEAAGVDSIRIVYAGMTGLDGLATESTPLAVSLADDCVSTFRYRADTTATGEVKAASVYYLTRGIIDRAPDSYKLYLAFRGETDELQERFASARAADPDLTIDWADSWLFERASERGAGMSEVAVDHFFADLLGYYTRVELVDTGSLYELHHWYAEQVRAFLEGLGDDPDRSVSLQVAEGDRGLLRTLVGQTEFPADSPYVATFEPGEPVVLAEDRPG
jgi:hypothetical protein